MPTILFDEHFSDQEKIILTKTISSNCQSVGISNRNFIVKLFKRNLPPRLLARVRRAGGFHSHAVEDKFVMQVNGNSGLYDIINSVGHEMTHVAQHLKGWMVDVPQGIMWKGHFYNRHMITSSAYYKDLPWEQQAFKYQEKIFSKALSKLTFNERERVMQSKQDESDSLVQLRSLLENFFS